MVDFWVRNHDLLQINFKHQKNKKLICRNFINMSRTYWEADQAQFLTRTWLLSFDLFFPKNKSVITSRIFEHFLYFYNDNKENSFFKKTYIFVYILRIIIANIRFYLHNFDLLSHGCWNDLLNRPCTNDVDKNFTPSLNLYTFTK